MMESDTTNSELIPDEWYLEGAPEEESPMIEKNSVNPPFPTGALGLHTLWDLEGVSPDRLNDLELIEASMLRAARACGATVLGCKSHRFEPQGVTALLLLAESHLAFHSWPERGSAAVDLFSCSPAMDPGEVRRVLEEVFGPERLGQRTFVRGGNFP